MSVVASVHYPPEDHPLFSVCQMGGQTSSVDILVGELVKGQELNISDSDDDGLTVVRGKNTHQLVNEDVTSLSRPFVSDFYCFSVWAIVRTTYIHRSCPYGVCFCPLVNEGREIEFDITSQDRHIDVKLMEKL